MSSRDTLIAGAFPAEGGGDRYRELLRRYRLVIAADAGGEWCARMGRVPDVVVGDFDSSAPGAAARLRSAGARVVEIPEAKDVTDLEACVGEARALGVRQIDFCAAFEGRIDHTLASIGAVLACADLDAGVREPAWSGYALDGDVRHELLLDLPAGCVFSLIAPGGAGGVSVSGATYPLHEADLSSLSGHGVSNVASGGGVTVTVRSGTLLVVVQESTGETSGVSNP